MAESRPVQTQADEDGHFRRKNSQFRNFISAEPNARFAPEKNRYVLYVNYGCPWAHRTIIVRALKSLEPIIQLVLTDFDLSEDDWRFTGRNSSDAKDPLYGYTTLKQLYLRADPSYEGRCKVPTLWDKKHETVVNNESSEIIRMLYSSFDDFIEPHLREGKKPNGGFYPEALRSQIDAMNEWVHNTINNGVYKCGFATSQEAYDANIYPLFSSLDRLEKHLSMSDHQPYLFGKHITEADIRLYTTLARFDVAYHGIFACNLKMIRHDYPLLSRWLRNLYWDESEKTNGGAFKNTTFFDVYRYGYLRAKIRSMGGTMTSQVSFVMPRGPLPDIEPLTEEEEHNLIHGRLGSVTNGMRDLSLNTGSSPVAVDTESVSFSSPVPTSPTATATTTGNEDAEAEADGGFSPVKIKRRTTYSDENAKWVKAAKKAEKKSGVPYVHLAL